ncbi:MAG: sulfotransferase [Rhodobacteraceae bacterium]|nr:sulfotransferase [Paracoccaceae bacterium]
MSSPTIKTVRKQLRPLKRTWLAEKLRVFQDRNVVAAAPDTVSTVLYEDAASRAAPQATYVVGGIARGGTSSIASICHDLGLFMGPRMLSNFEDRAFHGAPDVQIETIKMRNASHSFWGWKHPAALRRLDPLMDHIRNPRFILVMRDPVAVGLSYDKRTKLGINAAEGMDRALDALEGNMAVIRALQRPTLVVSYEKLILAPRVGVEEIADFIGMRPSAADLKRVASFVKPGRYRASKPVPVT